MNEIEMNENEIITTSFDREMNYIEKSDMNGLRMHLSDQSTEALLSSMAGVAKEFSGAAFQAISKIYCEAILAQERADIRRMDSELEMIRRFNDRVDYALKSIDLSNSGQVENFERVCHSLRKDLRLEFKESHRPKILGWLTGRK